MSLLAFVLILASAFMHAGWNFLCKSNHPTPSFMLVLNATTAVLLIPFFALLGISWGNLPVTFWYVLGVSVLANDLYCIALPFAYRYGDISVSYPLSRAIPVLLTAAVTITFSIGERPCMLAVVGLVILFAGCVLLPQKNFKSLALKNFMTPAMLPILLAAIGTTTYTISDSTASRLLAANATSAKIIVSGAYFFMLQAGLSTCQALTLLIISPRKNLQEMKVAFHQPTAYLAGAFNCGAYFLVLVSMQFVTNVSYVQAFRQMGLPIGVFLGIKFLHEKFTLTKILGVLLIISGLVLTVI